MPLYEGYYYAIAERDDLRAKFLLEPGEMLLWHNFQMRHARDAYQDSPEHTRICCDCGYGSRTTARSIPLVTIQEPVGPIRGYKPNGRGREMDGHD